MSRGYGKVQRECLAIVAVNPNGIDAIMIAAFIAGREQVTDAEIVAVRRALATLARAGLVVGAHRNRRGRKQWMTREAAERLLSREEQVFGKRFC